MIGDFLLEVFTCLWLSAEYCFSDRTISYKGGDSYFECSGTLEELFDFSLVVILYFTLIIKM